MSANVCPTVPPPTHLALLHRARQQRSSAASSSTPYCNSIDPDDAAITSSLLGCQCRPQIEPDEGLGRAWAWARARALLLGFNSPARPAPHARVSQSLGESPRVLQASERALPCHALPMPMPSHQAEPNAVTIPEFGVPNAGNTRTRQHKTRHKSMARHDKGPSHSPCTPARPPTCQLAPCSRIHLHLMSRRGGTTSPWGSSNGTARLRSRIPEGCGSRSGSRQYRYGRRKNLSSTPTLPGAAWRPGYWAAGRGRVAAVIL